MNAQPKTRQRLQQINQMLQNRFGYDSLVPSYGATCSTFVTVGCKWILITVRKDAMNRRRNLDHYSRKAKARGFAARSVFKLEEIHKRFPLMRKGSHVLDLGCAPGSWLKYAAQQVGPHGRCMGIDRVPIDLSLPNVQSIVGDIYEIQNETFGDTNTRFDLIMSDMAPDTCGNRYTDHVRSVSCANAHLKSRYSIYVMVISSMGIRRWRSQCLCFRGQTTF